MNFIEAAFIGRSSYDALENERLQDEELDTDELYVAMFALAKNAEKREAAKLPLEFQDIARANSGIYLASLSVLDKDLKPTLQCVGEFSDGYWSDVRQRISITDIPPVHLYTPHHSYIRTYDPDTDVDLQITSKSVLLAA